jgi:hypothetical protein
MAEFQLEDKVYLKNLDLVGSIVNIETEEVEHPHNGDVFNIIRNLSVNINDKIYYTIPDNILTKSKMIYKINTLEEELLKLQNAFIKM